MVASRSDRTPHAAPHDATGPTHEVFNQPGPLEPFNAYDSDAALRHWVAAFGGDWHGAALSEYGARAGGDLFAAGFAANKFKPEFVSHDRFGHRVDRVDYHPAYHALMRAAIEAGNHSLPWTDPKPGAQVARAALGYLHTQADPDRRAGPRAWLRTRGP